jgi:predicted RNase H-like nuclease (RuvC/YqgF family)
MRQNYRTAGYLAGLALVLASVSYGQSLGDVARQQRQNQQTKKDQPAPKVITNEDLAANQPAEDAPKTPQEHDTPHPTSSKTAEQWRMEIEAQKHAIADLQSRMEHLNSTIRFAESPSFYNSGQHNLRQEQKMDQVQRMQEQLEQQRKRLEDLQEGARKDGFGNAVYEP